MVYNFRDFLRAHLARTPYTLSFCLRLCDRVTRTAKEQKFLNEYRDLYLEAYP